MHLYLLLSRAWQLRHMSAEQKQIESPLFSTGLAQHVFDKKKIELGGIYATRRQRGLRVPIELVRDRLSET